MRSKHATDAFLAAVESRDLDAIGACFTPTARYANIPSPPAIGPAGIIDMFTPIMSRSERVQWDIVSASYDEGQAWLERVDRFWIDGREYSIECNGVYVVAPEGLLLTEVRDYVDLALWRERLGDVLTR